MALARAPIDLDKLEQLARAATPGPWEAWEGCRPGMPEEERAIVRHAIHDGIVVAMPKGVSREWAFADAAFIAAANPAVMLELRDLIEHLRGDVLERERYLVTRCAAAEAILRDLAARPEPVSMLDARRYACELCEERCPALPFVHAESCPWRRAVEATAVKR